MDVALRSLNDCYRHELTLVARYLNYAVMVSGLDRLHLAEFFKQNALDSMGHAEKVGAKLAARGAPQGKIVEDLGDVPRTPRKMLERALEDEMAAASLYEKAIASAKKDLALRETLVHIHKEEQASVDELRRLLADPA